MLSLQLVLGGWVVLSSVASCVELRLDAPGPTILSYIDMWSLGTFNTSTAISKNKLRHGMAIFSEAIF